MLKRLKNNCVQGFPFAQFVNTDNNITLKEFNINLNSKSIFFFTNSVFTLEMFYEFLTSIKLYNHI